MNTIDNIKEVKAFIDFVANENCGKCTLCRIGVKRLSEILNNVINGNEDIEQKTALELGNTIKLGALCDFGKNAANVLLLIIDGIFQKKEFDNTVLTAINNFYSEFKERAVTGTIGKSVEFFIDANKCKKCSMCSRHCPAGAISGVIRLEPFQINQNKCIKCWTCFSVCKFGAVNVKK
ncbi:MAG: 4Fe-4S binding protein [Bacilli bacterium]|nr:4Fe-4S binding protein [Bacilli bacterium]